jgi:hypothetical protein
LGKKCVYASIRICSSPGSLFRHARHAVKPAQTAVNLSGLPGIQFSLP